ncbi:stem-specific protein tsjt1, partial [Phtheirospermum japonicum]
ISPHLFRFWDSASGEGGEPAAAAVGRRIRADHGRAREGHRPPDLSHGAVLEPLRRQSSPDALLQNPQIESVSALEDGFLANHFSSVHPGSVIINLASSGFMAYSSDKRNPILPRMFAVVDDIFCLFEGHIENAAHLKQQYGLNKTTNEVIIVIEAYRTLRDRGLYPANQVVRDIEGKFTFILFDGATKATFIASDADGNVPLFWGTDGEVALFLLTMLICEARLCQIFCSLSQRYYCLP